MRTITDETAALLLGLLDQVTLSGAQPDLEDAARRVSQARRELTEIAPAANDGVR